MLRVAVVLALGVGIGAVATRYVLERPTVPLEGSTSAPTIRIDEGELERSQRLGAVAQWQIADQVRAPGTGVVTEVVVPSGLFHAGQIILRVNERPLVLVPGDVPVFRGLSVGVRGRDVAALQRFLHGLGYAAGQAGIYTVATSRAVKEWQRSLAVVTTGAVAMGDIVFVQSSALDAPMRWSKTITVGVSVAEGEPLLERLVPEPTITIEFGASPPSGVGEGSRGVATFSDGIPRDVILGPIHVDAGRTWAIVVAADRLLCRPADCVNIVPTDGEMPIQITFTLVPKTTGPLVPAVAIGSDASGSSFVTMADGSRKHVTIVVASGGSAIVRGINIGDEILLP